MTKQVWIQCTECQAWFETIHVCADKWHEDTSQEWLCPKCTNALLKHEEEYDFCGDAADIWGYDGEHWD